MLTELTNKFINVFKKKGVGPLKDEKNIMGATILKNLFGDGMEVTDPYKNSVWVYASVNAISQNLASAPFNIVKEEKNKKVKITEDDPLYKLFTNPNPYMSTIQLIQSTIVYMLLNGEAFWIMPRKNLTEVPEEIWCISPEEMEPYCVDDGKGNKIWKGVWVHKAGTIETPYAPWEVIQFKFMNPYDKIRGLSPLEAAKLGVSQDYVASKFNEAFFKEGAAIGGFISVKEELSSDQWNRIINQFEGRHSGYNKAHKIAIIDGDAKFQEAKISQRDMEFISLKTITRGEILAAFLVNEVILGSYENIQCFTDETEILTDKGFVSVDKIKVGDLVASLNIETREFEYREAEETFSYDYKGEMYTQEDNYKEDVDFFITPEHKMIGIYAGTNDIIFKEIKKIYTDSCSSSSTFYSTTDNFDADDFVPIIPKKIQNWEGRVYCLNVPPHHSMVSRFNGKILIISNSYEGVKSARKAFWEECLIPKIKLIQETLWSKFFYNLKSPYNKYWSEFDLSEVGALAEDFNVKVTMAKELIAMGFTANEVNRKLDLGFEEKEWRDHWWIRTGIVPADDIPDEDNDMEETDPAPEEPDPSEPAEIDDDNTEEPDDSKKMSSKDNSIYSMFSEKQIESENLIKKKFKRFFFEQRTSLLTSVVKGDMIKFEEEKGRLIKYLKPLYLKTAITGVELLKNEVEFEGDYEKIVTDFVNLKMEKNIEIILNTIKTYLTCIIKDSIDNNYTKEELINKIKEFYNKLNNRISTIAKTETNSIINGIRFNILKTFKGVTVYIKWLSNKSSRDNHKEYVGKTVKLGESFDNSFTIRFPTDDKAPKSEIINCNCYFYPVKITK